MTLRLEDLDPETLRRLGLKTRRKATFSKEDVRRNAIKVLAAIAPLAQEQRRRVLEHALRLNRV